MNRTALALAAALFSSAVAAAPASLTVWIPEEGQRGTLSAAGLVGAAGNRIILNKAANELPIERPLGDGFARFIFETSTNPARLEIVRGNKITTSRQLPEVHSGAALQGTMRGPCLGYEKNNESITRCFALDL